MRKKTKKTKVKVDFLTPIDIKYLIEESANMEECYGKEFDILDKNCARCHDKETCGILFKNTTLKQKIQAKEKQNEYLDLVDFEVLNIISDKIKDTILKSEEEGKPMRVDALYRFVRQKSKLDDRASLLNWITTFIKKNNLKVEIINKKAYLYGM